MFSHRVQAGVKVPAPSNLTAFLITVKLLLLPSPTALQIAIWVASFSTNFWTSLCCIFFSIDMLCLGMDSGYSAPKCVASVYFFVILTWGGLDNDYIVSRLIGPYFSLVQGTSSRLPSIDAILPWLLAFPFLLQVRNRLSVCRLRSLPAQVRSNSGQLIFLLSTAELSYSHVCCTLQNVC